MVYQRLVPIPAHRVNRRSSNGRVPQQDSLATEQRLTQLEKDNATLAAASRQGNRLSHFIGLGALVVAAASAWGGYQFNTWQQNNAAELASAQNAQEMRQATQEAQSYSALLSMACVLQSQQAFAELQYRPQAASQIFDALKMMEPKCQAVGVSLTARSAWLVKKYPQGIDRKIVERASRIIADEIPTVNTARFSGHLPDGALHFDETDETARRTELERDVESIPTDKLQLSSGFSSLENFIASASIKQRDFSNDRNDRKATPLFEPVSIMKTRKDQPSVALP